MGRVGSTPKVRLRSARLVRDALRVPLHEEGIGAQPLLTLSRGGFAVLLRYPEGVDPPEGIEPFVDLSRFEWADSDDRVPLIVRNKVWQ